MNYKIVSLVMLGAVLVASPVLAQEETPQLPRGKILLAASDEKSTSGDIEAKAKKAKADLEKKIKKNVSKTSAKSVAKQGSLERKSKKNQKNLKEESKKATVARKKNVTAHKAIMRKVILRKVRVQKVQIIRIPKASDADAKFQKAKAEAEKKLEAAKAAVRSKTTGKSEEGE